MKIRFKVAVAACWLAVTHLAGAAELPVIDAKTPFVSVDNAVLTRTEESLVFTEIGSDMKTIVRTKPFFAAEVERLEMRYRATGSGSAGGQLFYSVGASPYSERRRWSLPSMVRDGKWHVMTVGLDRLADKADWQGAGLVNTFRFDPTDVVGGRVEIAYLKFLGAERTMVSKTEEEAVDPRIVETLDADLWPACEVRQWKRLAPVSKRPATPVVEVRCLGATVEPCRATAGTGVRLSYDYRGPVPTADPLEVRVSLVSNGSIRWSETVWLPIRAVEPIGDDVWRLAFDYTLPLYINDCRVQVRAESPAIKCLSGRFPEARLDIVRAARIPGWGKPLVAGVTRVAGVPQFAINGKPVYALWGHSSPDACEGGIPRHSGTPLTFATIWPNSRSYWPSKDVFDPAELDRLAELHRRANPDAYFVWDISLYTPQDWKDAHPDDLVRNEKGLLNCDRTEHGFNHSFASTAARKDMAKMVDRVVRYLEGSPYANRIAGYRVNSGHTYEWLGWNSQKWGLALDFSPVGKKAFADDLKERCPGVSNLTVPTYAERCALDADGFLWDQRKHAREVAYNDFDSRMIADSAILLGRAARAASGGRKLIGTYYGYVMTLNASGHDQWRGHFATKHLLDSGTFDFLMSPQEYSFLLRGVGTTVGDMKPFASMQAHGVVSVIEDDTRTHNAPWVGCSPGLDEEMSVAILRRNMGVSLCRNEPFYTISIASGRSLDFPAFAEDSARLRKAGEKALATLTRRQAEIAVVVSEEAIKSTPYMRDDDRYRRSWQKYRKDGTVERGLGTSGAVLSGWPFRDGYADLARVGAPVDYLLAEDVADNPGNYRMYIFQCCHKSTPALLKAARLLRERDCTILWTYAPGYVCDSGNSIASMKELTGLDFVRCKDRRDPELTLADGSRTGAVLTGLDPLFAAVGADEVLGKYADGSAGLVRTRTGRARTVFSGSYVLETPLLQKLARDAGVFLYSDSRDPMEANERFVTLHARRAGEKTIRLPHRTDVVDVFNGRLVARGVDSFSFEAPLHSSWLFYCADDAASFLKEIE